VGEKKKEPNEVGGARNGDGFIQAEVLDLVYREGELNCINERVYDLLLLIRCWDGRADTSFGKRDAHLDPDACPVPVPCSTD